MSSNVIGGNGFEYTFNEDGTWFYKAVPFKIKVAETPQIKGVIAIEKNYQELFDKKLVQIVKDIARYLG